MAGYSPTGMTNGYGLTTNGAVANNGMMVNQTVWLGWNSYYTIGCDQGLTGSHVTVWQAWNTATNVVMAQDQWIYWNNQISIMGSTNQIPEQVYNEYQRVVLPETEEQTAALAEARAASQQAIRDAEAKRIVAKERARATLVSHLREEQRQQLAEAGAFDLQVNDRLYRVTPGRRVKRLDPTTKKVLSEFCIHPEFHHALPDDDVALGHKLYLEANEAEFLRIANETRVA